MSKLPVLSAHEIIKFLTSQGFKIVGRRGSHIRLKKRNANCVSIVIVPNHKELSPGTLLSIIRQSRIPKENFISYFDKTKKPQ